jgi:hypothetical protein
MFTQKIVARSAALLVALTPFTAGGQNLSSTVGVTRQDIGRVVLLPGPYLLSPARNAPQVTENIAIVPKVKAPTFRFVPASERFMRGQRAPSSPCTERGKRLYPAKNSGLS